jgi:hypothetical protein
MSTCSTKTIDAKAGQASLPDLVGRQRLVPLSSLITARSAQHEGHEATTGTKA